MQSCIPSCFHHPARGGLFAETNPEATLKAQNRQSERRGSLVECTWREQGKTRGKRLPEMNVSLVFLKHH